MSFNKQSFHATVAFTSRKKKSGKETWYYYQLFLFRSLSPYTNRGVFPDSTSEISICWSSDSNTLTPTQAEQNLKVMGKLEQALSFLGERQMVSHIGPDGKWRRVSHLTLSSCRFEGHAACNSAFVCLFLCVCLTLHNEEKENEVLSRIETRLQVFVLHVLGTSWHVIAVSPPMDIIMNILY